MSDDPILIDVSRLIWRRWTRRLPTGIDRVCLAYLKHFAPRSRAVVQFRRFRRILDRSSSERLFELLLGGSNHFRSRLVKELAVGTMRRQGRTNGQIYLNVGHTGLNSPFLAPWLVRHELRPVFLIHDLIPITHPQYCRAGEDVRHAQRIENALRAAMGLIVNSVATQRDLATFAAGHRLPLPPCRVAWLGIDGLPVDVATQEKRARPYFVLLGTIEARKNHLTILKAWSDLVARHGEEAPDLIVIGQRGWEAEEAISVLDDPGPLKGHVHELSGCDDERMRQLLAGARALLMPSFVEGFGLPLIEALQQGVPAIASDLAVFREISGDIPTYLDSNDPQAWSRTIFDYAANGAERQRQLERMAGFETPSWNRHFDLVDQFLETL